MKRKIILPALLIALTFSATGCNASAANDSAAPITTSQNHFGITNAESGSYPQESPSDLFEIADSAPDQNNPFWDSNQGTVITQQKKVIKNGSIDMTAKNVEEAYDTLLEFVQSQKGYEFSRSLNGNSSYQNLRAVIKVPPVALDAVMEYAEECGKVINIRTSTDDITADYTDAEIRLENQRKALEKYYGFLENASTMDEIIILQQQIDRLTADIESYEGRLRLWNSQIAESTLEIYIQQENDPDQIPEDIEWDSISLSTMGKLMKNGFITVVNGIVSVFQWIVIALVTISPVLIPAAIIIILIVCRVKKKKRSVKQTSLPEEKEESKE